MKLMNTIFAFLVAGVLTTFPWSVLAQNVEPADAACVIDPTIKKCEDPIKMSGGTLSPAFQTGTLEVRVPKPYLPENSYCYPVFYQVDTDSYKPYTNFHIWIKDNRWVFRSGQSDVKAKVHVRCFKPDRIPPRERVPVMLRNRVMFDMPQFIGHSKNCHDTGRLEKQSEYEVKTTFTTHATIDMTIARKANRTAGCLCRDLTGYAVPSNEFGHVGYWSKKLGFIFVQDNGDVHAPIQRLLPDGSHAPGVFVQVGTKFSLDQVVCQLPPID